MKTRLDRWLTLLGEGSRSEVKQWIRDGQAAVNGRVIRDPALSFETETDRLVLAQKPLDGRVMRHVMLYKPTGVLTAARDPKQKTVMDLLPEVYRRIGCMPAGRLDKDTTGLLILTCDGEMNHRLLSPGRHVNKMYRARVRGRLTEEDAEAFARGLDLGDFTARPAKLRILNSGETGAGDTSTCPAALREVNSSLAEVEITEGKFHQVKRMFEAVGHEVLELHRFAFGPLVLDPALGEGDWRELTGEELSALRQAAGMEEA